MQAARHENSFGSGEGLRHLFGQAMGLVLRSSGGERGIVVNLSRISDGGSPAEPSGINIRRGTIFLTDSPTLAGASARLSFLDILSRNSLGKMQVRNCG